MTDFYSTKIMKYEYYVFSSVSIKKTPRYNGKNCRAILPELYPSVQMDIGTLAIYLLAPFLQISRWLIETKYLYSIL